MELIAVLGAGESGLGAALLAQKKGFEVFVSDFGEISNEKKQELIKNEIPFEEKGHSIEKLEKAKIIIKSPGIPEHSEVIKHFRLRDKMVISEIEWASRFYPGKIIAVTGSNGKTTTSSLIYHTLKEAGINVGIAGNIGKSMAALLCIEDNYDWLVLELSSFQLDDIETFQADIGCILNISADHLDRYDYQIENYADAKWNLALAIKTDGHLIVNQDDVLINKRLEFYKKNVQVHGLSAIFPMTSLSSKDDNVSFEIRLKGKHNLFNAIVAMKTAEIVGIQNNVIYKAISTFKAIEHRLEPVIIYKGVEYINDSKATNVDSTKYALEAMEKPVIWIAGGTDKGNDYQELIGDVKSKVKVLICLCKDDSKLRAAFSNVVDTIFSSLEMKEAIEFAQQNAESGDAVLLSPACASFDLFDNYEHRGQEFKNVVLNFLGESTN